MGLLGRETISALASQVLVVPVKNNATLRSDTRVFAGAPDLTHSVMIATMPVVTVRTVVRIANNSRQEEGTTRCS